MRNKQIRSRWRELYHGECKLQQDYNRGKYPYNHNQELQKDKNLFTVENMLELHEERRRKQKKWDDFWKGGQLMGTRTGRFTSKG